MLQHNERALDAQLSGIAGVTDVKIEGKTVKQFVIDVLQDQIASARKQKLTWVKGTMPESNDPKKRVGKLRLDQAYVGPIGRGRYYVQNMRVFLSNGTPIKDLRSISDKKVKEMVRQPGNTFIEVEFPSDKDRVEEALALYARQAAINDPNLCPYCFQFSSVNRVEMSAHVFKKHPTDFNREMATASKQFEDDEPLVPANVTEPSAANLTE